MSYEGLRNKSGSWLLKSYEDAFKTWAVPKLPRWLETYHLTYSSLLWSFLVVLFFSLGVTNQLYLIGIPVLVVLQYLTDVLDGEVGRYRNTGLVGWGYYVDHLLDFVFMTAILLGYGIVLGFSLWLFVLYAIVSGLMVHAFLLVSATDVFKISFFGIGPTEGRLVYIIAHLILVAVGIQNLSMLLPYLVCGAAVLFLFVFGMAQKRLWKSDMEAKRRPS